MSVYAGTSGVLDDLAGRARCGGSRPSCSSGSGPATPACSPRSATPARCPTGDALADAVGRLQGDASPSALADEAARAGDRRRPLLPSRRTQPRSSASTDGWRSGTDPATADQERSSRRRRSRARRSSSRRAASSRAQARCRPRSPTATPSPRWSPTSPRAAAERQRAARRRGPRVRNGRAHRDRGRPWAVRCLQLDGDPRPRRRAIAEDRAAGRDYRARRRAAARPRATSATATTASTLRSAGSPTSPRYEDARADRRRPPPRSFLAGETDLVEIVYTRVRLGGHPGGRAPDARCRSSRDEVDAGDDAARPPVARASYEFEPAPDAILDLLLPALRRGARLRRAAQRGGVGARAPASGR